VYSSSKFLIRTYASLVYFIAWLARQ